MFAADCFRETIYQIHLQRFDSANRQCNRCLLEFEKAFEIATYKAINRTFTRMFSFATVVGILKLTSYEVRNIDAITFAVEQGIPVQTVMTKLIITE
ncbi:MAG: V-type ATPase subunit [Nitrosopumilaceae archaeon]